MGAILQHPFEGGALICRPPMVRGAGNGRRGKLRPPPSPMCHGKFLLPKTAPPCVSRKVQHLAVHGHTLPNMDAYDADELITPREVARRLSVAEETLASWRSRKKPHLPFLKLGRLVRYRRSDLVAFVQRAAA